jgi:hypothetical protein
MPLWSFCAFLRLIIEPDQFLNTIHVLLQRLIARMKLVG